MQNNLKLHIAYDGGAYLGWQKTKTGPSIQETLEDILSQILQEKISLNGASRTDRGVHAINQVANFKTTKDPKIERLLHSLNRLLPSDITVTHLEKVDPNFHATLDAKSKTYTYHLTTDLYPIPHARFTTWHLPYTLDDILLEKACKLLTGSKNFKALTNQKKNETYSDHTREITEFSFVRKGNHYTFTIKGSHFMYKMVRNLIGLVVAVALNKIPLSELPHILASGDRTKSGITAPAHGLFLKEVLY